ncbi:MAG: hypothetical protein JWM11_3353 [Planctomycetaceae bacterium]|nr:hypothetical protein [Planctomycetaceae bacterium]
MSVTQIAGTGADDASYGAQAWSNPGNITANDGTYASYLGLGIGESHYLKAASFSFGLGSDQIVDGVEVTFHRSCGSGNCNDTVVKLVVGGTVIGTNNSTGAAWPSSLSGTNFGGASDLWGTGGLTYTDVNSSSFGVVLAAQTTSLDTALVDYVEITVYSHTVGDAAAWINARTCNQFIEPGFVIL